MKKILSAITAFTLLTGATAGLSVNAAGFGPGINRFSSETTMRLMEAEKANTVLSVNPSASPSVNPSASPSASPSAKPSETPSAKPTETPTAKPTETPTVKPTEKPTEPPTSTPAPTAEPTVKGLALNRQTVTIKENETFKLIASTEPEEAPDETVEWKSGDANIASVDENGTVKGVSAGRTIISAVAVNSKYMASCYVIVEDERGTLNLDTTEGVASVVITMNGYSDEIKSGSNSVWKGTYTVEAKSFEGYTLNSYDSTVTVEKGKTTDLKISAVKSECKISLPSVTGVTVTPVNGSVPTVAPGGSYSFTISVGDSYASDNLAVKANGVVVEPENGVYTVSNITDDVVITIDGISTKSWDATLKSVKVKNVEAVLGSDNIYTATLEYGDKATLSDIVVTVNDEKSQYSVTSDNGMYVITVKAEDGTTNVYKLNIVNAAATVIDSFKLAIADIKFNDVTQKSSGSYDSQDTVRDAVNDKIKAIADEYKGISYVIENGEKADPVKGTLSKPDGEDGYYVFTVTLKPDMGTADEGTGERVIDVKININGYDYTVARSNITATTTTMTVKNLDSNCEVALFYESGGRLRSWQTPTNGIATFSNLTGGESYTVKMRAVGSTEIPETGTMVTMDESRQGASKYYTVTFDEGEHGRIVSGKAKQTVGLTRVAAYPTVEADDGYIFKGWSSNGKLIENPSTYYIRSTTAFTAIYERSSGSSINSSSRPQSTTPIQGPATPSVVTFYDVPANSWYYNNVMSICNKGYMNGTSNNKFEPDARLTRGMLVTILYRYACEPDIYDASTSFVDVKPGQWYSNAVVWAADAGIVNGVDNTHFAPDANITREQLAAIMYRYSLAFGYDVSAAGNIIKYSDSASISDWAQTALIWTTGASIIDGKDGNRLDPQGLATRAEAATIIGRFDDFINR